MNELLGQLSLKAHIKIRNQFTGFFNKPETTIWGLAVEHCTHRGITFEFSGHNLDILLQDAFDQMNEIERDYKAKTDALKVLHPDKDEYDIAEMARSL